MPQYRHMIARLRRSKRETKTARDDILETMETAIATQREQVRNAERAEGQWTFAAVEEAFEQRVELDRVCYLCCALLHGAMATDVR